MAKSQQMTLKFCGAAGTVTGSKHLITAGANQVLLDCGIFQGFKDHRLRNWMAPPFDPKRLTAVVLSHAHIDHTGFLPRLLKFGYAGPIYCTPSTKDLVKILLPDSAYLQEEEAANANRYGYSRHKPALPLYTMKEALEVLEHLETRDYFEPFEVADQITMQYRPAGHILGAATVETVIEKPHHRRLVFSGDLGRWDRPILHDPQFVPEADVLLLESTYGDRLHATNSEEQLIRIIKDAAARKGAVIVPAFAVGRTQELVWLIRKLENENKIPVMPVFVDSPMAKKALEIYIDHTEDHDDEFQALSTRNFHVVESPEESKRINEIAGPVIIISASGMMSGGRVLHHLKQRLGNDRNTILIVGYQAEGTRGRILQDGAKSVRIHGTEIPVQARVEVVDGLSGHADQAELLKWLSGFQRAPKQTYLVHGEPQALSALTAVIKERLGWNVRPALDGESVPL